MNDQVSRVAKLLLCLSWRATIEVENIMPERDTSLLAMPQNIYDSEAFFEEYSQLPRSKSGLAGAVEWPTMKRFVGDVTNSNVLDLGCGYGWFCRWASEAGARSVDGVDISKKMIERAHTFPLDSKIKYQQTNLETIELREASYDLVYSSLTFHYLPSLRDVFARISRCLKPGGNFVFSVEHPVMTAPSDASWKKTENGQVFWPLDQYANEGLRVTHWLGAGEVHKYHHRIETYLSLLIENGLVLEAFRESWDDMDASCSPNEEETGHRPYFLLVKARRPKTD